MLNGAHIRLPSLKATFANDAAGATARSFLDDAGLDRVLLIGSPAARERYGSLWDALEPIAAGSFFLAEAHCPESTVEACRNAYRSSDSVACVVAGGGSSLGLGKILRAEEQAAFVAIPTTYSGSEATAIFGRKISNEKRTQIDDGCRPDLIVYDASLTAGLPAGIGITSAMNSIAHAVEALYPKVPAPVAASLARDCLHYHHRGFELINSGNDAQGRESLLYGGFLGGLVIGMTGIALHHQLCHIIGGLFDLPHAESNAVVLPQVLAYNHDFADAAVSAILSEFGGDNAAGALFDFVEANGGPVSLQSIGMPETGIEEVVQSMLGHQGYNPRPLEETPLRELVTRAFEGTRPDRRRV